MTGGAIVAELPGRMIRILHRGVIRLVTLPAIGVCQVVVAVYVAGLAGLRSMGPLEGEIRRGMIEGRGRPGSVAMTCRAVMRELCRHVVRILRPGEVGLVALPAIGVRQVVVAVLVA